MKRFEGLARIGFVWIWELMGLLGSMSVPIANVLLAIPWGWVFARWAYAGTPDGRTRRAWILTLHSVIPCFALTLLPVILWAASQGEWDILDPMDAYEYGIPIWLGLPFPFNTIFGFYWGAALAAIVLKIILTTAISRMVLLSMASRATTKR